jgi:hypothetical protein
MLNSQDLDAAVKSGVITAEQAAALRRKAITPTFGGETETPRVTRGFNDVLLALGTALIGLALMSQWFATGRTIPPAVFATIPVLWVISEILDVRRKAVLPGIVAAIGISLAAAYIGARTSYMFGPEANLDNSFAAMIQLPARVLFAAAGAVALVNAAYYARFRLPFALLPLALGIGIAATNALIIVFGWEKTAAIPHILGLGFGILLFVAAMKFDTSDPLRQTRAADCGFWLHLAAAPLIVHSLLSIFGGATLARSGVGSGLTVALITALTLIALVIDRRALIVASLSYLLAAVGYVVTNVTQALGGSLFASLIVIGVIVLIVGMGWQPARRLILAPFRGQSWLAKLPPVQA